MTKNKKALLGLGVMLLVCVTAAFAAVNVKGAIINALTGFQVAGAAPSGHSLCGNGTVYVDCNNVPATARAWVSFNGVGGVSIHDSFNVASVVRTTAGEYLVTFTNPMPTANYAFVVTGATLSGGTLVGAFPYDAAAGGANPTTTTVTVAGIFQSGSSLLLGDLERCDLIVYSN